MNMNQEKMGLFIAQLRKEKKLSQYALAELIPISRDAVSKWERGRRCPEPECLLKLSEIFKVSVNELLYGERQTKSNSDDINKVSIKLYNESNKTKKALKILIVIIILLIFSFLIYYFVSNYNSLKVYHIYYESENIKVPDGILVMTNEKVYFNLGGIVSDDKILEIELFYKDKNNNISILKTDESNIIFNDFKGYNEYLDFSNIKYIVKNLYLKVLYSDSEEVVKLNYNKKLSNDNFFTKYKDNSAKDKIDYDEGVDLAEENIKKVFKCDENFCNKTIDNYELIYSLNARILTITLLKDNKFEWIYNFENKQLILQEYVNDVLVNKCVNSSKGNVCELGECTSLNAQIDVFNDIIKSI